jgi:hypothetical protein
MMAVSCAKTNFKSEIAQVDSLENVLVSYSLVVDTIDVMFFDSIGTHTTDILAELHKYYDTRGEELPLEDGIAFGNFKAVKKGVKNFTERLSNIKKEINYSNSQLSALNSDMEASTIDKELAKKYYLEEKHAIEILEKELNSLTEGLSFAASRYDKMLPDIKLKMERVGIADSIAW